MLEFLSFTVNLGLGSYNISLYMTKALLNINEERFLRLTTFGLDLNSVSQNSLSD